MKSFLTFLLVVVKIYIFVRFTIILFMTSRYPESHSVDELIWWSSFLVFDLWLMKQLPEPKEDVEP